MAKEKTTIKRLTITLTEERLAFVKWLTEDDGLDVTEELASIFWCEFDHVWELYREQFRRDTGRA